MIYPVITLYQPWATWIMREWKTIETRTHNRFKSLNGKRILIHAGKKTDKSALSNSFLTKEQIAHRPLEMINGYILGSAFVKEVKKLSIYHGVDALIECETDRWGLTHNTMI